MSPNLDSVLKKTAKRMGVGEQVVLDEVARVAGIVAQQINFSYYDVEDIKQEGIILGLEALSKYDFTRPLGGFLYIDIRNRILNLKRKIVTRTDPPCLSCHESVDGKTKHSDGRYCGKYKSWKHINSSKRGLAEPQELDTGSLSCPSDMEGDIEISDFLKRIDAILPIELRSTYLKMRAGEEVDPDKKEKVESFVKELMNAC